MPDQSSASTEHALMQEITAPLARLPDDPVPIAASVAFPSALRGYDRIAVDAYVQKTSQLVAELQATRSPESAVRRALERVGEEVAGILQRAHDTAAQITAQSRSEAEDRLEAVRREAAEIITGAQARVRELDAETDRIWAERHRIVEDTRGLARELLTLTETAAERFPADEPAETEAPPGDGVGAPADDEAEPAAPELFSTRDEGDREARLDQRTGEARHDDEPDIESTAVLPTVDPPRAERTRAEPPRVEPSRFEAPRVPPRGDEQRA
jgi:cell division septum initiation protein DivIVA